MSRKKRVSKKPDNIKIKEPDKPLHYPVLCFKHLTKNKKFKELFPTTQALQIYDRLIGFETIYIQSVMKNLTSSELFQLEAILNKIENSQ